MRATALRPPVESADRFALTLCLAIIVHVMIVLGVSFAPEPRPAPKLEGLEITLVTQRSPSPPEDADALAQANLRGGGERNEAVRPATPVATPLATPAPAIAAAPPPSPPVPRPPLNPAVPRKPAPEPRTPTALAPPTPTRAATPPARQHQPRPTPVAVAEAKPVPAPEPEPASAAESAAEVTESLAAPATPALPTAAQLITRSFALASLDAELQQKLETHAKRPRQKFISANTQEYRYAAYMEAWRAKVERIGNLNYPDEARQKQLSGALLLDVALRPDGSVIEILVRRSSGHKVLDDAAVRIVELAAPFAPFPDDIAREIDVLHVTRTWKFLNNAEFAAQ